MISRFIFSTIKHASLQYIVITRACARALDLPPPAAYVQPYIVLFKYAVACFKAAAYCFATAVLLDIQLYGCVRGLYPEQWQ